MRDINFWKEFEEKFKSKFKGLDFEIVAIENKSNLTRFAQSLIHQNMLEENLNIRFKIIKDNKVSMFKINDLNEQTLSFYVKKALDSNKLVSKLDYHYDLLKPQEYKIKPQYSPRTANYSPMERAQQITKLTDKVNKRGYEAFGALSTDTTHKVVINSEGLFAYAEETKAELNSVITRGNSSAYDSFVSSEITDLKIEEIGERLLNTALQNVNQEEIEPGTYTVILSPEAIANLIGNIPVRSSIQIFNGKLIMEGRSFFSKNRGKKIFPDEISISDDPSDKETIPITFDYAGYPRKKIDLIKNGIIIDGVYDWDTALKYGKECTGNTLPPAELAEGAPMGAMPFNIVIVGGKYSLEDMISSIEHGVYINRLHYVSMVNPNNVELTGMTRDGIFLIKKGRIDKAIKNTRFSISLVDLLKGVTMVSKQRERRPGIIGPIVSPYLKSSQFNFIK